MIKKKMKRWLLRDEGWTFVEATLSIVIMAIMVLGLSILMMAFREHLDRSWAVRTMDQYGNDVVERLTHALRNAINVEIVPRINNYDLQVDDINVINLDNIDLDRTYLNRWRADLRSVQVRAEDKPDRPGLQAVDPLFPPRRLGRGEWFEIRRFTLSEYGKDFNGKEGPIWSNENADSWSRTETFNESTYLIRFALAYHRNAINPGDKSWKYEKEYNNRIYMRNKNLPIRTQLEEQGQQ